MKLLWLTLILCFNLCVAQQIVVGNTVSEDGFRIPNVQVINISNGQKTMSDSQGEFRIVAKVGDELRYVKENYERSAKKLAESDFLNSINIILIKIPTKIEEVEIVKLSGDLAKDSKRLTRIDKIANVKKSIGLPEAPEKLREKPADLKKDVLGPLLSLGPALNIQAVYDLVSGKSRRLKRLYKYEDLQERIIWIKERIDPDYFISQGVEKEKINEFLQFSLMINPNIGRYISAKNISAVELELDKAMEVYKKQIK